MASSWVFLSFLMYKGMIGVSVLPTSNPRLLNFEMANWVFLSSSILKESSDSMISREARAAATAAGVGLALKIKERELCLIYLMVAVSLAINPPIDANDLLKVPQ